MDEDNKLDAIENANEELAAAIESTEETAQTDMPTDSSAVREELERPVEQPDQDIEMAEEKLDAVAEGDEMDKPVEPDLAVPAAMEEIVVESEIEPPTTATTIGSEPVISTGLKASQSTMRPTVNAEPVVAPVATPASTEKKPGDNKRLMLLVAASLVLIAAVAATAWILLRNTENDTANQQETSNQTTPEQTQANVVTASLVEGTVEYQRGAEAEWQTVSPAASTLFEEGDMVRTGADSRAVLAFEDGNAVRLDANTTMQLTSLTAGQAEIEQTEGRLYSRVTPNGGSLTIYIDEVSYQATGAAFGTIKMPNTSGVQAYYGSVHVSEMADAVAEGSQYYAAHENAALQGEITNIDIAALSSGDAFILWNVEQDKLSPAFAATLGILAQLNQDEDEIQPPQSETIAPAE